MCTDIYGQEDHVNGSERSSRCYSANPKSETYVSKGLSERGDASIKRRAEDDCLPACGSLYVFGNDSPQQKSEQELLSRKHLMRSSI